MANTDSVNFYRVVTLLVDGGTKVMQKHLQQVVKKQNMTLKQCLIASQQTIKDLQNSSKGRNPILTKEQVELLLPSSGLEPDLKRFDLTLLYCLFKNLFPQELLTEMDSLREQRNTVYGHARRAFLDAKEFHKCWGDINRIILDLVAKTKDCEFEIEMKEFIANVQSCPLDVMSTNDHWMKVMKEWCERDVMPRMKSVIDSMEQVQLSIEERVQQLQVGLDQPITSDELDKLKTKLIDIYEKKYKDIQISPMSDFSIPIDEIYTKVVMLQINKSHIGPEGRTEYRERPINSYQEIFFDEGGKRRETVYLRAPAGKGKTTWCYELINNWRKAHEKNVVDLQVAENGQGETSKGKLNTLHNQGKYGRVNIPHECLGKFEFLFFIPLRHAAGKTSVIDALFDTTLLEYTELHTTVTKVLKDTSMAERVLFVCDGLDEHEAKALSRKGISGCSVITTTRPWKFDVAQKSMKEKPELLLELKGLDDKGKKNLVTNILKTSYKDTAAVSTEKVLKSIQSAGLTDVVQIPLILTYIVHLWWHTQKTLPASLTQTIMRLMECIIDLGRHRLDKDTEADWTKNKNQADQMSWDDLEREWMKEDLPASIKNAECSEHLQHHAGLLLAVAEIAFDGLVTENKENALVFRGNKLKKYFKTEPQRELQICLEMGLLSKSSLPSVFSTAEEIITFYHKLIQEFFAALLAAHCPQRLRDLCEFCKKLENVFDVANVYTFLCGIDADAGLVFSRRVAELCFKTNISDQDALSRLTEEHLRCLKEMGDDGNLYITHMSVAKSYHSGHHQLLLRSTESLSYLKLEDITMSGEEWIMLSNVVRKSHCLQIVDLRCLYARQKSNEIARELEETVDHSNLKSVTIKTVAFKLHSLLSCLRSAPAVLDLCIEFRNDISFTYTRGCGSILSTTVPQMTKLDSLELHFVDFETNEGLSPQNTGLKTPVALKSLLLKNVKLGAGILDLSRSAEMKKISMQKVSMSSESAWVQLFDCMSRLSLSMAIDFQDCDIPKTIKPLPGMKKSPDRWWRSTETKT